MRQKIQKKSFVKTVFLLLYVSILKWIQKWGNWVQDFRRKSWLEIEANHLLVSEIEDAILSEKMEMNFPVFEFT
jgi:hypothetical protein